MLLVLTLHSAGLSQPSGGGGGDYIVQSVIQVDFTLKSFWVSVTLLFWYL